MKIERLNENQIRCTLTREDLADRKLKLSELAYGTEKAKSLFREMMQQAAYECGFEANDIPLMIEAIPMSADSIILIITKVEDPEELDTRFAKFSQSNASDDNSDILGALSAMKPEGADDILNLFQKIRDAHKALTSRPEADYTQTEVSDTREEDLYVELKKIYGFHQLDDVIRAAHILQGSYTGMNSLYKDTSDGTYHLVLNKSSHSPEEFNRICNMISEYGTSLKYSAGTENYLVEHGEVIVLENALQKLAAI